ASREPMTQRLLASRKLAEPTTASASQWRFVEQRKVNGVAVQTVSPTIQVFGSLLYRVLGHAARPRGRENRLNRLFEEILVQPTAFIQQAQRGLHPTGQHLTVRMRQTFVIYPADSVHNPHMSGLREEYVVVDEAPNREQRVQAASLAVVAKNASDFH